MKIKDKFPPFTHDVPSIMFGHNSYVACLSHQVIIIFKTISVIKYLGNGRQLMSRNVWWPLPVIPGIRGRRI